MVTHWKHFKPDQLYGGPGAFSPTTSSAVGHPDEQRVVLIGILPEGPLQSGAAVGGGSHCGCHRHSERTVCPKGLKPGIPAKWGKAPPPINPPGSSNGAGKGVCQPSIWMLCNCCIVAGEPHIANGAPVPQASWNGPSLQQSICGKKMGCGKRGRH